MLQRNQIVKIQGSAATRNVYIDGVLLDPTISQKILNHSPDGFMWGYGGSGPAQLALAICLHLKDEMRGYHNFKWEVIAKLNKDSDFEIMLSAEEIETILAGNPFLSQKVK